MIQILSINLMENGNKVLLVLKSQGNYVVIDKFKVREQFVLDPKGPKLKGVKVKFSQRE